MIEDEDDKGIFKRRINILDWICDGSIIRTLSTYDLSVVWGLIEDER